MKRLYCLTCGKELKKDSKDFTCSEECFNKLNISMETFNTTHSGTKMEEYQDRYCVYCGKPFTTNMIIRKSCSTKCSIRLSNILKYRNNDNSKEKHAEYYRERNKTGWFLYKFIDKDNKIIYIGRTNRLERRLEEQHLSENQSSLPKECYDQITKIQTTTLYSKIDMKIYEMFYIAKLKPIFNTQCTDSGDTLLSLPDLIWENYEFDEFTTHNNSYALNIAQNM